MTRAQLTRLRELLLLLYEQQIAELAASEQLAITIVRDAAARELDKIKH